MGTRILCLDFDGVLHAYSKGYHDGTIYDGPVPGAMDFLREAVKVFDVHIYSTRSATPEGRLAMRDAIKAWLYDAFCYPDAADILYTISFPDVKPMAFVTLDDRAITFTGTFPAPEELAAFEPWTKRVAPASDHEATLPPYPYARLLSAGDERAEIVMLPENR